MKYVQDLLTQPACRALGWALLNFLWQGTLAALLLAACNFALRDAPARARYAAACFFLLLLLALPVLTFTAALVHAPPVPPVSGVPPSPMPSATMQESAAAVPSATRHSFRDDIQPWLPSVVAVWIAGVVLLSLRWIGAWTLLYRLRRAPSPPVPAVLERILRDLMRRAAVSLPVRLAIHPAAEVPCVIGWLRPVILMPAASLASLDWRALEALLAHELAHIRRHDFVVNLLQTTVDTLLFYHPAVWWISRQVRIERENCCDDMAARICGDRLRYARALVDLEQCRANRPAFAMSAGGGSLMRRIQRLLHPVPERRGPAWFPALAGLAAVACMLLALHAPVRAGQAAQTAPRRPVALALAPEPAAQDDAAQAHDPQPQGHDFLSGIVAAGFHDLTVDELIELKIHGVTPEFAQAVKQAGFPSVTAQELVHMSIHGVDLAFLRAMRANGLRNLSIADLISLRIHGVTPDYIAEMKSAGYPDLTADQLQQCRIHGVDADFVRQLRANGQKNLSVDQLLRLKISGF